MNDKYFIEKCLKIAEKGLGLVSPNPLVGSVIVDNENNIISEGYHEKYGGLHAEINALNKLKGKDLSDCTLYCNLEPCSHNSSKKINPPCAPQIIRSGIKKVVIGMVDPYHEVCGNGINLLKEAGIDVKVGVLEKDCEKLNRVFITNSTKRKPFILLKMAQTLDGRIATSTGSSRWITNKSLRTIAHQLRVNYDAVMVGSNTVIKDDPKLNVRHVQGRNPKRLVIDSKLKLPLSMNVFSDELKNKTTLFTSDSLKPQLYNKYIEAGVNLVKVRVKENYLDLDDLITKVFSEKINSFMVEGGAGLITQFLKYNLADMLHIAIAPKIIGEGINSIGNLDILDINNSIKFKDIEYKIIDNQVIFEGLVI